MSVSPMQKMARSKPHILAAEVAWSETIFFNEEPGLELITTNLDRIALKLTQSAINSIRRELDSVEEALRLKARVEREFPTLPGPAPVGVA